MIYKFIALLINLKNQAEYNSRVRETKRELSRLSDYDLHDIGLSRGDIYHISHSSYKKPAKVSAEDIAVEVVANENLKGFV
ncbi:DUF1127 domain-containing protein [bacterium]|nr:DUF1127 domain-containing protein [bacterium]